MNTIANATLRVPRQRPHGRPGGWVLVMLVALGTAVVAWFVDAISVAVGLFGIAVICAAVAVAIQRRRIQAGRDELISMIDANIAARGTSTVSDSPESLRQREAVLEFRQRLAGGRGGRAV
jgi:hypothetical protein